LPIASGCSGWSRSTTTRSLALAPRLRLNLLPGLELGIHAPPSLIIAGASGGCTGRARARA
jgi:hypothetical protein